jgi:hypothetical protein
MEPDEYRAVLAVRLLMSIFPRSIPCPAPNCGYNRRIPGPWTIDCYGFHPPACQGVGKKTHSRHEIMANTLGNLANDAGLDARVNAPLECLGEDTSNGSVHQYRPADVLMNGPTNRRLCVDVTIASPLSEAKAGTSNGTIPGQLAAAYARAKFKKHYNACVLDGKMFLPFALDVCGIIDASANELIQHIAYHQSKNILGRSYSEAVSYCRRRISFALHLGVARQLVAAMAYFRSSEEVSARNVVGLGVV